MTIAPSSLSIQHSLSCCNQRTLGRLNPSSFNCRRFSKRSNSPIRACFPPSNGSPLRCAVLGAGFAGLSVVWHLLQHSPRELNLQIDIFDEFGIGGGASGVSGGLLHPYSPKIKLLWKGAEYWRECLNLLNVAEKAAGSLETSIPKPIIRRRGILRPAVSKKYLEIMSENAENCFPSCRIEKLGKEGAQNLIPNMCTPLNSAFFMPEALNINPQSYLQALFLACQNVVQEMARLGCYGKSVCLQQKLVSSISDLAGDYDAVVICLGARVDMLSELTGKLPLRTCRGVIAHLQLLDGAGEVYPDHSPSILSDAWLAVEGTHSLHLGATWDWRSRDYSPRVSLEEASRAFQELLPKARAVYPCITDWTLTGARAGLRSMPPLTAQGSLPVLGCIDDIVGARCKSKVWLVGGLGSRGLLYHGWVGKMMALAVLSSDEEVIPSELTSWRKKTKS